MTQRDNILQELNELNSRLALSQPVNTYAVPPGYFEGLAAQVLSRIRAMEAVDAAEELSYLSPLLSGLPKQMPYTVPAGYFEGVSEIMTKLAKGTGDDLTAAEETASISRLLGSLKKEMPFTVPTGYFENLASDIAARESKTEAKVISLSSSRKWFRYAAAAAVAGIIFMAGFLIINKPGETEPGRAVFVKVSKDIKKLNNTQKDDLIDFLNSGMTGTETARVNNDNKSKEIQQLLQDVSEEELKDFQEQSEDLEEVLMTN